MREMCAHFTDAADEANFLARPFLVLLAELLCRIFGKIEDIVLLWRAGLIPPPAPKPAQPQRTRRRGRSRARTPRRRTSRRTPGVRPESTRTGENPFPIDRRGPAPRKPPLVRRIDRYPKTARNQGKSKSFKHIYFVTY
jgi:hypothetical protein